MKIFISKSSTLVIMTAASFAIFLFVDIVSRVSATTSAEEITSQRQNKFTLDTPGCQIPGFEIMHEDIRKFYKKTKPVDCKKKPPLTFVQDGQLRINNSAKSLYGKGRIQCCYTYIYRVEQNWNHYNKEADSKIRYGPCRVFEQYVNMTEDFVGVYCREGMKGIYKNTHASVSKRRRQNKPNSRQRQENEASVLIIGLDSASRLNFRRQMPQTLNFLEQMGFIEYFGYNKVGDNTYPNLLALLTGYSTTQVTRCRTSRDNPMDNCPLVWKNFSKLNYATFYAEDMPTWGTFIRASIGFLAPPTDFYYRPYALAVRGLAKRETDWCYGYQHDTEHLLGYTKDFVATYKDIPFFALSWTSRLGHGDMNDAQLADPLHFDLFSNLNASGVFENAFVIFMSDHGVRFGDFRSTYYGFMEERLPAFWSRFPDWFSRKYPQAVANFRANAHKLTSPYDLHRTFLDLLNTTQLANPSLPSREDDLHGQSLFTEISPERTCSDAGIDDIWCTCHQHVPMPVSNPVVERATRVIIEKLNEKLRSHTECAQLKLSAVLEARWMMNQFRNRTWLSNQQYVIRFQTLPGKAEMETLVKHDKTKDVINVSGTLSRLNRYNNESHCVTDPSFRHYCYCNDLLN